MASMTRQWRTRADNGNDGKDDSGIDTDDTTAMKGKGSRSKWKESRGGSEEELQRKGEGAGGGRRSIWNRTAEGSGEGREGTGRKARHG